jgi:hypothetical protein
MKFVQNCSNMTLLNNNGLPNMNHDHVKGSKIGSNAGEETFILLIRELYL